MISLKPIAIGIVAALLGGAAIVTLSDSVGATTCNGQITSSWNTTKSTSSTCGGRDGRSIGKNGGSLHPTLQAELVSGGVHAYAFGYTVAGDPIASCFAEDLTLGDGPGAADTCNPTTRHRPSIVF
jgi:hypothetical protein